MAIGDDLLRRAKEYDRGAMEELLADVYPVVYRMAHALTGRPGAGRQVVHDVIRRSLRVLPGWRTGAVPENWFYHHTLLSARGFLSRPPEPRQDLLVTAAPDAQAVSDAGLPTGEIALAWVAPTDASYVAFVRALRNLPAQQAEAFILHHGERLNERLLGVAMDCSMAAAATHLGAANATLNAVTAGRTDVFAATMARAYRALTPPPATIAPASRKYVARAIRPRILRRILRLLVLLSLLAGGYFAWRERARWLPFAHDVKTKWWDNRGAGSEGAGGGGNQGGGPDAK
jgi:DNA-directed RNA polymerase specialized sigma24 family protein